MLQLNSILLATAGGPSHIPALERAALLAKAAGARELPVAVLTPRSQTGDRRRGQILGSSRMFLAALGLDMRFSPLGEHAPREIAAQAAREQHDVVVVADRAKGRRGEGSFGDAADEILASCPCAVWLVRPLERLPSKRILAAIDVEPERPEDAALNLKVLEFAALIARIDGGELHLVNAWYLVGGSALRTGSPAVRTAVRSMFRETHERHRKALAAVSYPVVDGWPCSLHVRRGAPEHVIPNIAETQRVDVVMAGYAPHKRIGARLRRNTAEEVLDRVTCSVVGLKLAGRPTVSDRAQA